MKISFNLRKESNAIRVYVTFTGFNRIRMTIRDEFKLSDSQRFIDGRATGKNSKTINRELDRIEEELEELSESDLKKLTQVQVTERVQAIVTDMPITTHKVAQVRRVEIDKYFEMFLNEKSIEINPKTKKRISPDTIRDYKTAFRIFNDFNYELEDISKTNYHAFAAQLLQDMQPNYFGKIIRKLKTFFIWCDEKELPIHREYKNWQPINESKSDEEKALNIRQLRSIYELEIDPIDVYEIAKSTHGKKLDKKQLYDLCGSVKRAANQAVAMASIGAHKEDFWKLKPSNVKNNLIVYKRGKNTQPCIAPFVDNHVFHAREFADMNGEFLYKRMTSINYYLTYVKILCDLPFHVTASNFRKTFASILYYETTHPNRLQIIMKALGHTKEETTRIYLGIQLDDLAQDHSEIFKDFE